MIGMSLRRAMVPYLDAETYTEKELQAKARRSLSNQRIERAIHLLVWKESEKSLVISRLRVVERQKS